MEFQVDSVLPSRQVGAISREELRAYAEASRDLNPIHLDDEFAKNVGLPSVIVHGMFSMGVVANYVRDLFESAEMVSVKGRFRKITLPDIPLKCTGKVVKEIEPGLWLVKASLEDPDGQSLTDLEAQLRINS